MANMYEYSPKDKKTREKSIFWISLVMGSFCFTVSGMEGIALPFLYQLFAVLFFAGSVVVAVRYLMRSYRYCLEQTDGGIDFTVTEQYGKRIAVVCRISLEEILEIRRASEMDRSETKRWIGKKFLYPYVASIRPKDSAYLLVQSNETQYLIKLCADQGLIDRIKRHKRQYLSDSDLSLS
jgi:hypothetical protein